MQRRIAAIGLATGLLAAGAATATQSPATSGPPCSPAATGPAGHALRLARAPGSHAHAPASCALPRATPAAAERRSAELPTDCLIAGMDDRCENWAAISDNAGGHGQAGGGFEAATGIATSPSGDRVFITGTSVNHGTLDFSTVAYDTATGTALWSALYDGPAGAHDVPYAVTTSADGTRVYVAGLRDDDFGGGADLALVAYDAASGAMIWETAYAGAAGDADVGTSVAASSDGARVYVTGLSHEAGTNDDYATVAFAASSGALAWAATYEGTGAGFDVALSVQATAARVFVTGLSKGTGGDSDYDYATIAYAAGDGARLWATRYDGGIRGDDEAISLGISPDGSRVFVTGGSQTAAPGALGVPYGFVTIAYEATSGARAWASTYAPATRTGPGQSFAYSLAVAPAGDRVFVAGISQNDLGYAYATAAFDAATGAPAWASRFEPPGATYGLATSVAVSRDGARVYTAGVSFEGYFVMKGDVATVAHDAGTGSQAWAARFTRPSDDVADILPYPAYAATGASGVFVTGTYLNFYPDEYTTLEGNFSDQWTLAYAG